MASVRHLEAEKEVKEEDKRTGEAGDEAEAKTGPMTSSSTCPVLQFAFSLSCIVEETALRGWYGNESAGLVTRQSKIE
jgi:hypothetical protein